MGASKAKQQAQQQQPVTPTKEKPKLKGRGGYFGAGGPGSALGDSTRRGAFLGG